MHVLYVRPTAAELAASTSACQMYVAEEILMKLMPTIISTGLKAIAVLPINQQHQRGPVQFAQAFNLVKGVHHSP
jgi:ATP phosphoribosyltransferase